MFKKYAVMPIITASPDKPDWVDLKTYGIEKEEGFFYFSARAISEGENDNADCFPPDELRKAYKTFEGKPLFLNHQSEDISKAVGKVVKAYLIEEIPLWIKTIVALDEKNHPDLADKVRRGIITDVSMGCYVQETVCSVCGNVAKTEFDFCEHIKAHKGSIDPETKKKVFEICRNIEFYELSLVTSGADPDAMVLELLASDKDSSIELIEKLPIYSESSGDGIFLFKKFDYDIPSYIIVKKEKDKKQFLPISFYYSYRVPGRWTDSEEDALNQLESRGVLSETKVVNYFATLTLNPRIAKILEPVFQTFGKKEEPLPDDKNLIRKALRNGAIPLSGLPPSEALSVWNKLESEVGQIFKVGDFVKFNGRVHKIIHLKDGIAELLDSDNNLRKAVEYMLSRTFPPAKKAIFERYLEISGKSEDEAYDAFVSGKELEFDKTNALRAYYEVIGDKIPEDKIEGLAVLLSRKPWLDFDRIADNLKKKSDKGKDSKTDEKSKKAGYLNIIFYIKLDAEKVNYLLSEEGIDYRAVPQFDANESKIEHIKEEDIEMLQKVFDENGVEYSIYTIEPLFPMSQKKEENTDRIKNKKIKGEVWYASFRIETKDLENISSLLDGLGIQYETESDPYGITNIRIFNEADSYKAENILLKSGIQYSMYLNIPFAGNNQSEKKEAIKHSLNNNRVCLVKVGDKRRIFAKIFGKNIVKSKRNNFMLVCNESSFRKLLGLRKSIGYSILKADDEELRKELIRLFTDAEGGTVVDEGIEFTFHIKDMRDGFPIVELIPTEKGKQTEEYIEQAEKFGDNWYIGIDSYEDGIDKVLEYAYQALESKGLSRTDYNIY